MVTDFLKLDRGIQVFFEVCRRACHNNLHLVAKDEFFLIEDFTVNLFDLDLVLWRPRWHRVDDRPLTDSNVGQDE